MVWCTRRAILCAVTLSLGGLLWAQDQDSAKIDLTKKFILNQRLSREYRESARKSIVAYEQTFGAHCKNIIVDFDSVEVRDQVLDPVETDEKGVAIAGSWRERVPGTACGEQRRFNLEVDVTDQGLQFTATFPGDAQSDSDLQQDTLKNIELNFRMLKVPVKKSCRIEVVDTHLIGPAPSMLANGFLSPWKESWDVRTCGTMYSVPIAYSSDDKGTYIDISTNAIKPE